MIPLLSIISFLLVASASSASHTECELENVGATDCLENDGGTATDADDYFFCSDRYLWKWSTQGTDMPERLSDALAITMDESAVPGLEETVIVVFQGCNQESQTVGGFCSEFTSGTYVFKPDSQEWEEVDPMPLTRVRSAAANATEHILVFGGRDADDNLVCQVDAFNVLEGTWSTLPTEWPDCTSDPAAFSSADGTIFITGGYTQNYNATDNTFRVSIVNTAGGIDVSFEEVAPMGTGRGDHKCWQVHGTDTAYCMGGFGSNFQVPLATMEQYNIAQDTWTIKKPMSKGRGDFALAYLNGRIHVIGGEIVDDSGTPTGVRTVEWYDNHSDCWTGSDDFFALPYPRFRFPAAAYLPDTRIFVFGGQSPPVEAENGGQQWPISPDTFWFQERTVQTLDDGDGGILGYSFSVFFFATAMAVALIAPVWLL